MGIPNPFGFRRANSIKFRVSHYLPNEPEVVLWLCLLWPDQQTLFISMAGPTFRIWLSLWVIAKEFRRDIDVDGRHASFGAQRKGGCGDASQCDWRPLQGIALRFAEDEASTNQTSLRLDAWLQMLVGSWGTHNPMLCYNFLTHLQFCTFISATVIGEMSQLA